MVKSLPWSISTYSPYSPQPAKVTWPPPAATTGVPLALAMSIPG